MCAVHQVDECERVKRERKQKRRVRASKWKNSRLSIVLEQIKIKTARTNACAHALAVYRLHIGANGAEKRVSTKSNRFVFEKFFHPFFYPFAIVLAWISTWLRDRFCGARLLCVCRMSWFRICICSRVLLHKCRSNHICSNGHVHIIWFRCSVSQWKKQHSEIVHLTYSRKP